MRERHSEQRPVPSHDRLDQVETAQSLSTAQGCHVPHTGYYFLHVHLRSHDTALSGWSTMAKQSPEGPRTMEIL